MWRVVEEREATKAIDKLPPQIAEKYAMWAAIVQQSGPEGLRRVKGFHDEKLAGKLAHLRSSRLSIHWRVIYSTADQTVTVERITKHDY